MKWVNKNNIECSIYLKAALTVQNKNKDKRKLNKQNKKIKIKKKY
jgi:hypothetical protein